MSNQETNIGNYIPINRNVFKHAFWLEKRDYSKAEAWIDLLQLARFELTEGKVLIGGSMIIFGRGEIVASVRFLVQRWQWSIGKVTRFIELLKEENMINTRICSGQTVIIITNYNMYNYAQNTEQQAEHLKPRPQRVSAKARNTKRNTNDTEAEQTRNESNNDNKEEYIGGETPTYTKEEENMFRSFMDWIERKANRVNKMKEPFTIDQYLKLKNLLKRDEMQDYLLRMHNWQPLLSKNLSAYLTILNWSKKEDTLLPPVKSFITGKAQLQTTDSDILKQMGLS